jgi:hypothetical protein
VFQPSLRNHPSLSRLGIHLHRLAIFPEPSSLAIPPGSARTSCSHTPSAPVPSCVRRRRRRPRWRRLAFHDGLAGRLSCSGRARRAGSAPRRLRRWDPCRAGRGRRASSCGSAMRTRCRCSSSAAMSDTGRRKKGRRRAPVRPYAAGQQLVSATAQHVRLPPRQAMRRDGATPRR